MERLFPCLPGVSLPELQPTVLSLTSFCARGTWAGQSVAGNLEQEGIKLDLRKDLEPSMLKE